MTAATPEGVLANYVGDGGPAESARQALKEAKAGMLLVREQVVALGVRAQQAEQALANLVAAVSALDLPEVPYGWDEVGSHGHDVGAEAMRAQVLRLLGA